MKELTILSGKGGTGKTTVCAAFAALAANKVLSDCDVDAADLHLLLDPTIQHEENFIGGRTPQIDYRLCMKCGHCQPLCRFEAIDREEDGSCTIDALACEHCGLCALACPGHAIRMVDAVNGRWFISATRFGTLVHARLGIGEDNSGKLVTLVRREARRIAEQQGADLLINDGPPGIGCPATAAIAGTDGVLIVTEPTISGLHDLRRVIALCRYFRRPALVCINKYDLNEAQTALIQQECRAEGVPVVGLIPFEPAVSRALVARQTVVDFACGPATDAVVATWEQVQRTIAGQAP
ncbi:MAG: ATP-binding protein [Candidatus Competibacteraceae bacterium]|nr:ATP-binding protein [Candidatus Competibacteraceae bacterium]